MSTLLTYVVCFVEYYDRVFGHLLGDLLSYFRVQKVVEGVDDDINERHLENARDKSASHNKKVKMQTDRTPDSKIRAGTRISPVLQDVCQSPDARW